MNISYTRSVIATAAVATAITLAPAAQAHDQLTGTNPKNGATVQEAPKQLELKFAEKPLTVGNQIAVKAPDGSTSTTTPIVNNATVATPFTPKGNGTYTVTWRVVSGDGHPVSGTYSFTLAGQKTSAAATNSSTAPSSATSSAANQSSAATTSSQAASSDTKSTKDDDSSSTIKWTIAGAVVAAVLAGLAVLARRRGR